jgi:hypothetical protein
MKRIRIIEKKIDIFKIDICIYIIIHLVRTEIIFASKNKIIIKKRKKERK